MMSLAACIVYIISTYTDREGEVPVGKQFLQHQRFNSDNSTTAAMFGLSSMP